MLRLSEKCVFVAISRYQSRGPLRCAWITQIKGEGRRRRTGTCIIRTTEGLRGARGQGVSMESSIDTDRGGGGNH